MGTTFNKAIVALVVPIVLLLLAKIGVPNADDTTQAVSVLVTAIIAAISVYLTPNKPAA